MDPNLLLRLIQADPVNFVWRQGRNEVTCRAREIYVSWVPGALLPGEVLWWMLEQMRDRLNSHLLPAAEERALTHAANMSALRLNPEIVVMHYIVWRQAQKDGGTE